MLARAVAAYQAEDTNNEEDETLSFLRRTIRKRFFPILCFGKQGSSSADGEISQRGWHHRTPSQTSSGSSTPPPSYHTSPRTSLYQAIEDADDSDGDETTSPSGIMTPVAKAASLINTDDITSGVRWRYARRGLSLLSLAVDGESALDQDPRFNRKLYLDSIGYMLQGLPNDLTAEEEASVLRALPDRFAMPRTIDSHLDVQVSIQERDKTAGPGRMGQTRQPSMLHRAIAAATFYLIIFLNFILPYVQLGLEKAYRYDRKHQISDRMLVQGISAADAVSRYMVSAAGMVCVMNDGEVGKGIREVALWWLHESMGGLYDGVGQETLAEEVVEIDGINYYTLLEQPTNARKDAPVVLLVHALMSSHRMWDATVKTLTTNGYRTLRYDHIGHNKTSASAKDQTQDFHMDDLTHHAHTIVKARTGHQDLKAVVGCSIGGTIAFRYAQLFSDDVEFIISLCSPGVRAPAAAQDLWAQRIKLFEEDVETGKHELADQTIARWFPGDRREDDAVRAESLGHVLNCSFAGYRALADAIRDYDYEDQIAATGSVKTLVLAGQEDKAADAVMLEDVADKIPGAEFGKFEETGHLPPMQKPEEFGERMMGFLGPAVS
ncbi:hypothetical protein LTR86_003090 [Recurvomyces mirabilis]|nr:hypothetical protein LTR86_003090 [Recurvomyces mirabilis]